MTRPHPWAPMTDEEWQFLRPLIPGTTSGRPGRPTPDARARLDAIFRAVTLKQPPEQGGGRAAWNALPPEFGKADTVSRTFRRWAKQEVWVRLLRLVSDRSGEPTPLLLGLRWRVCCAFRRGIRHLGLRGIVLARTLGLYSALPAPSTWLPDPGLSEIYHDVIKRTLDRMLTQRGWQPPRAAWRLFRGMLAIAGGRRRIARWMEPA